MLSIENHKIPSSRNFGIVFFIFFFIVAIFPLFNHGELRIWSIIISVIFLTLGILNSKILEPLNKLWYKFGLLLGKIISPLVIGVIFFLVITPIAYILRFFKKDILNLKYNNNKSYWIEKNGPKSEMKNQF